MYKNFEEIAKQKGKKLLIESFPLRISNIDNIRILEKNNKLIESEGKKYDAIAVLEGVDVTRYVPNANKRLYPKKLWERIQKEGVSEGSSCFANHAEDSQNVLLTCGIWHNFKAGEETGKADLYLIGENGKLLLDALKAGANFIEFSTVGFGEFEYREEELSNYKDLEEGIDVICWDSFDLDHLADWVHNSSQGVRATSDNIVKENSKTLPPSTTTDKNDKIKMSKDISLSEKVNTNNNVNFKETNKMAEKLELANYKESKRKAIKEAVKNPNKKEGLDELLQIKEDIKEVLEATEAKSLVEQVDKSIDILVENLNRTIMEQATVIENFKKKDEMTEDMLEDLRKKYNKSLSVFKEIKKSIKEEDENTKIEGSDEESNDVTKGEADNGTMTEETDVIGAEVVPVEDVVDEDEIVVKEAIKAVKASIAKKKQEASKKAKSKVKEEEEVKPEDNKEDEKKDAEVEVKKEETDEVSDEKKPEDEENIKESIKTLRRKLLKLEQELVNNDKEDETKDKNEVEVKEEEGDAEDSEKEDKDDSIISESALCKKFGIKSLKEVKLISEEEDVIDDEENKDGITEEDEIVDDEDEAMTEEDEIEVEDEEEIKESTKKVSKFKERNFSKISEASTKSTNWIGKMGFK